MADNRNEKFVPPIFDVRFAVQKAGGRRDELPIQTPISIPEGDANTQGWSDEGLRQQAKELSKILLEIQSSPATFHAEKRHDDKIVIARAFIDEQRAKVIDRVADNGGDVQADPQWQELEAFSNVISMVEKNLHADLLTAEQSQQKQVDSDNWTVPPESVRNLESTVLKIENLTDDSDELLHPELLISVLNDELRQIMRFEEVYRSQPTQNAEDKLKKLNIIDSLRSRAEKAKNEVIFSKWQKRIQTLPSLVQLHERTQLPIPATRDEVTAALKQLNASIKAAKEDPVFAAISEEYESYLEKNYLGTPEVLNKKQQLLEKWADLMMGAPEQVDLQNYVDTLRADFITGSREVTPADISAAETAKSGHLGKVQDQNLFAPEQINTWKDNAKFIGKLDEVIKEMNAKLEKTGTSKQEISNIRAELAHLEENENLLIAKNTEKVVDNAYKVLIDRVNVLRREAVLTKESLDALERDIHLSKFKTLWGNFDKIMNAVVNKNISGSEDFTLIENFVLPGMDSSAKRLSELYVDTPDWNTKYPEDPEGRSKFYLNELKALKDHWGSRKSNNFTWHFIQGSVLTKGVRKIPDVANTSSEDELPFVGKDDYRLTCLGQFRYEHAQQSNYELGTRWFRRLPTQEDYDIEIGTDPADPTKQKILRMEQKRDRQFREDPNRPGVFYIEESFKETAAGFFKRFYDQVYRGDLVLYDASGDKMSVATLHDKLEFLVDRAYEAVNTVLGVDVKVEGVKPTVPRQLAKEMLRESSFVTFHQSDLTDLKTTGTSDEWFYITHYDEYSEAYIEDQMGFSKHIKRFFVGRRDLLPLEEVKPGYTNSVGEVVTDDDKRIDEAKRQERLKKLGFSSFRFLHNAPLIRPRNVAVGYKLSQDGVVERSEKRTFETPLSTISAKIRFVKDGKLSRIMTVDDVRAYGPYKKKDERTNSGVAHYWDHMKKDASGNLIDDRITNGDNRFFLEGDEYPYELIAEKHLQHVESQFVFNYVKNISSGPLPLYKNVLGNSQAEAVNKVIGVDFIKELRKEGKYLFPLLGTVGFLQQYGEIIPGVVEDITPLEIVDSTGSSRIETESEAKARFKKAVAYQVSDVLILAVCDIMTSNRTKKDKRWGIDQVYEYLQELFENDAITQDEAVVLYLATVHGRHLDMFANQLGKDIETQVRDLFKYRK